MVALARLEPVGLIGAADAPPTLVGKEAPDHTPRATS